MFCSYGGRRDKNQVQGTSGKCERDWMGKVRDVGRKFGREEVWEVWERKLWEVRKKETSEVRVTGERCGGAIKGMEESKKWGVEEINKWKLCDRITSERCVMGGKWEV